jgi:hypothetical protein
VNKTSDTHGVENVNDGFLRKDENNEEAMKETVTANVLGNSQSTNISKPRNVSLTKNGFECDVCLKVIVIFHLRKTLF